MARLSVLGPRTRRKIHTDFLEGKLRFGFWSCKGGAWYLVLGCDESKIGLRFSIKLTLKGRAVGAQGPKRGGGPGPRGRSKPRRFGSSYPGQGRSKPRPIEAGPIEADRGRGRSRPGRSRPGRSKPGPIEARADRSRGRSKPRPIEAEADRSRADLLCVTCALLVDNLSCLL